MDKLLSIIMPAVIGAIVAYFGFVWQTRLEARRVIHEKVYESRARLYPSAWKLTGRLPRRPTEKLTYESLENFSVTLRDWYYAEGGMYLSGGARRAYSTCQDEIQSVLEGGQAEHQVGAEHYERVRDKCSLFRTWLTRDLLSRSRAPMGGTTDEAA